MSPVGLTKADTLKSLTDVVRNAKVPPLCIITLEAWLSDPDKCVNLLTKDLGEGPFIVRSSCRAEDTQENSNAGAFLSVLDVALEGLSEAIENVFASYPDRVEGDQVLVQPMLRGVVRSGVVFSHDQSSGYPYRMINWTDGECTDGITGGSDGRLLQIAAGCPVSPASDVAGLIDLANELLEIFDNTPIDFEFAFTKQQEKETLWLLQVRPLIIKAPILENNKLTELLNVVQKKIENYKHAHPFVVGNNTVFGVMPDWNPAEIVGVRPRPLALSLYREMITDVVWAYQRHNYGYRNLRSFPLMPNFFGLPYIDVRLSFNSFVPSEVNENLAGKLVDYYIDRLISYPNLHDKVEFEIVLSCYTFDLDKNLDKLKRVGFLASELEELKQSLRTLTNNIVHPQMGLWRADAAKLETLAVRRKAILGSNMDTLEKLYWLIEDGKRYGTLPFAGLARAAFVAVQLMRSLVEIGVLNQADYDNFSSSVSTVNKKMVLDRQQLNQTEFLKKYGHLRPGTYDILSSRYDEAPELYFDWNLNQEPDISEHEFSLSSRKIQEIDRLLLKNGLEFDCKGMISFIKSAIELREFSKFEFTKNISEALVCISDLGAMHGFCKNELSFASISVFKELKISTIDEVAKLKTSVEKGKEQFNVTKCLSMPPLIVQPMDVWSFEWPDNEPNFITQKKIIANTVPADRRHELEGAIVCIPSADPGFDWLFSYKISGLITAWGGANSHMAIRASELGLPAVIGVGEKKYQKVIAAKLVEIDCVLRKLEVYQ